MRRDVAVAFAGTFFSIGVYGGIVYSGHRAAAAAASEGQREQRIMEWIVERNPGATIKDFRDFPGILVKESGRAGIDYLLVMAIIDKESQFNPRAVGAAGEIGLMQLLPSTAALVAKDLGMEFVPPARGGRGQLGTLGDPRDNVRLGVAFFRDQMAKFGKDPVTALRAYNRGDAQARQHRPWDRYPDEIAKTYLVLAQRMGGVR